MILNHAGGYQQLSAMRGWDFSAPLP